MARRLTDTERAARATRQQRWKNLTPAYKKRLIRAGITREKYIRGESRSAARGHAATPERPSRATRNPEKYSGYLSKQNRIDRIGARNQEFRRQFDAGDIRQLNVRNVAIHLSSLPDDAFNRIMGMSDAEWKEAASRGQLDANGQPRVPEPAPGVPWLVIDGDYTNPFWYH